MIQLPSNLTTAALALVLGVLIGAGSTYALMSNSRTSSSDLARLGEMEGVLEQKLDRPIAEEDTASQDKADLQIRYRTRTDTVRDSVYVLIPSQLSRTPRVSSATPIEVTEDRVTWTHFNTAAGQWQQSVYSVPRDNLSARAHALSRARAPLRDVSLTADRTFVGVGIGVRYGRLSGAVRALTTPGLSRQRVEVGLRWRLAGRP